MKLTNTLSGIFNGRINGFNTPNNIEKYIRENEKTFCGKKTNYLIGFGIGYEQGQVMKTIIITDKSSKMKLNDKIECFSFLLNQEKNKICNKNYNQLFLENINMWGFSSIPSKLHKKTETLITENKTQRVIELLYDYYVENFNLKPLLELSKLRLRLKEIRIKKRKNKDYDYLNELEKLRKEFISWKKTTTHNNVKKT